MTTEHRLTPEEFDRLARGAGGTQAVLSLRAAQLSKHLLLISRLLEHWPGDAGERDAVVRALETARAADPAAFGEILGAPLVGAWASIVNRALLHGGADWQDVAHLNGLAVVACAAAGVDADVAVPVRDGVVSVPGVAAAAVDAPTARLVAKAGRLTVEAGGTTLDERGDGWLPVRHLTGDAAGRRIRLGLDDLDPFRHGHHAPPASRLPVPELQRWQALFDQAWRLLAELLPIRAAELQAGLRTLVPLAQTDERAARSATIRHAFGVFGLTRPPTAAEFAVTLVHEFQHSKLSAILDLMALTDPTDRRRFFAPWRADPRPIAGLLQGVYAFVGVAETWQALRADARFGPHAQLQFAEARLQVDRGLSAVEESGALTPQGASLAAGLRRATDAMLSEPVPAAVALEAEQRLERTKQRWLAAQAS